jgi:hypothetical protein
MKHIDLAKNPKGIEVSPTLKDIQRELSLTKLVKVFFLSNLNLLTIILHLASISNYGFMDGNTHLLLKCYRYINPITKTCKLKLMHNFGRRQEVMDNARQRNHIANYKRAISEPRAQNGNYIGWS